MTPGETMLQIRKYPLQNFALCRRGFAVNPFFHRFGIMPLGALRAGIAAERLAGAQIDQGGKA